MLPVERNREWHWSVHNVRERRSAPDVVIVYVICFRTCRTKIASEIISKIKEILSPDLHHSVSIFESVSWIDPLNMQWPVISIWQTCMNIVELSCQRNLEINNLWLLFWWGGVALDTCLVHSVDISFLLVETLWFFGAFCVSGIDYHCVEAKFTFWVGERVH